jgi:hypothetical protein
MDALLKEIMAPPSQVFVPVRVVGREVLDNGGDVICICFTPALAQRVAELINADSQP